jgi:AbrB family looped-hinge helix DNA binding protein
MIISTLTSKGQTTIPKPIRNALHLNTNDKIVYESQGDKFVIYPLTGQIASLRGSLKVSEKTVDLKAVRESVMDSRSASVASKKDRRK